jgi:CMP-N-acetylneuraminic acid synthetase
MKIVGIIPARGGSKAIPRKNIKDLNGKPLIAHIIGTALKIKEIDKLLVSTDDQEVANISKKYGAEVPFIRPEELATDETPTLPVLQHAVQYLEEKENYKPDIIVLLYATTPMTTEGKISEAINNIIEKDLDSVISVVVDHGHYWTEDDGKFERFYPVIVKNRQIVKPLFKENGAVYVCTRELLMEKNLIAGGKIGFLKMDKKESIDIDDPLDYEFVEFLMKKR